MIGFDVILKDGRVAHLRPSGPADEAEFLQAFERMSNDARYMRFMRVVREPDRARLRAVLASFPEGGIGIVATVPADDGIDIVGSAVAVFAADRVRCEFAITVGASCLLSANCHASDVSFAPAGRTTYMFGMARRCASCSIGWCVGPSSPRPIESWVKTQIDGIPISADRRIAPFM